MKKLIYISTVLILFSCGEQKQNKNIEIPDEVIPFETMSNIMLEVQLMESQIENERAINPSVMDSIPSYYNSIFKKHNVTKNHYDSSLMFYSKNILLLDSLYNNIFAELKEMEIKLNNVSLNQREVNYMTRNELIVTLKKIDFQDYITSKDVNFLKARDSLEKYVVAKKSYLDSLQIDGISLKYSFNLFTNSHSKFDGVRGELLKNYP